VARRPNSFTRSPQIDSGIVPVSKARRQRSIRASTLVSSVSRACSSPSWRGHRGAGRNEARGRARRGEQEFTGRDGEPYAFTGDDPPMKRTYWGSRVCHHFASASEAAITVPRHSKSPRSSCRSSTQDR
jgi:hypothetical protein